MLSPISSGMARLPQNLLRKWAPSIVHNLVRVCFLIELSEACPAQASRQAKDCYLYKTCPRKGSVTQGDSRHREARNNNSKHDVLITPTFT